MRTRMGTPLATSKLELRRLRYRNELGWNAEEPTISETTFVWIQTDGVVEIYHHTAFLKENLRASKRDPQKSSLGSTSEV